MRCNAIIGSAGLRRTPMRYRGAVRKTIRQNRSASSSVSRPAARTTSSRATCAEAHAAARHADRRREPSGRECDHRHRLRRESAPPDGYTLTLGSASPLAISPFTYPNIPATTRCATSRPSPPSRCTPEMLAIHPSLPARNLKELVALAKSQPGKLNFASSGNGGLPHLAIELFKKLAQSEHRARAVQGRRPGSRSICSAVTCTRMIIDLPAPLPT